MDTAIEGDYETQLTDIKTIFKTLAESLSVDCSSLESRFKELSRLIEGVSLSGKITPRVQAQVMVYGELLLTQLAVEYLKTQTIHLYWQDYHVLSKNAPHQARNIANIRELMLE